MSKRTWALALFMIAGTAAASAPQPTSAPALRVERVAWLMRHGVRPPTKAVPMPAGVAAEPWPAWSVPPGNLTDHGAASVRLLGAADRARLSGDGLLPRTGCPARNSVRVIADSDQRTIATAQAWAAAALPGCPVGIEHRPQGEDDPMFSPIDAGAVPFDAATAQAAVLAAAGDPAAADARSRPLLTRLDFILCGNARTTCGVSREPTALAPASPGKRPKLTGGIDRGSTAAQILLLQYAEDKPLTQVGWGRATPADVAALSALHATEFAFTARPPYIAARNLAAIGAVMARAITDDEAPVVTLISGHDTTVASLGGLLGVHWQVSGYATDDPAPGGALGLERLVGPDGHHYVRAVYRAQTLDGTRTLSAAAPARQILPIPGCSALGIAGLCTVSEFNKRFAARLVPFNSPGTGRR